MIDSKISSLPLTSKIKVEKKRYYCIMLDPMFMTFTTHYLMVQHQILVYTLAVAKVNKYFSPTKYLDFKRTKVMECNQRPDESTDAYHVRLRDLAGACNFAEIDDQIRCQIARYCTSAIVRRKIFREAKSLDEVLDYARGVEMSERQAQHVER